MRAGPLDGILVADFTRVLAGPLATMTLGDLGADVIKVESPDGDETRHWRPPESGGASTYYLAVNRNKRSVVLDLADAEDRSLARELVARADVMVDNFKPGGLERLGLPPMSFGGRTLGWCTVRSRASATALAPNCRATTRWCRRSRA